MKSFVLAFAFLLWVPYSNAQIFHEDFEVVDSVTYSSTGPGSWEQNNRLATSGAFCDSATILAPGDIAKMTTISFSTTFIGSVFLYFNHICKIEFFDNATIQYSLDGGITWATLIDEPGHPASNCYYLTNSLFRLHGSRFNEASYAGWFPGMISLPDSTMWKREVFDVSQVLAFQPDVRLRFVLADGNNSGGAGRSGWYIDDILVSDTLNFNNLPLSNQITGKVFVDYNSNAIMDSNDIAIENYPVYSNSPPWGGSSTDTLGNYSLFVQQSDSVVFFPFHYGQQINYFNIIPSMDTAIFSGYQQTDSLNDFAFQPLGNFDDLAVTLWNPGFSFIPGMSRELCLKYWNNGTTVQNQTLVMHYDSNLTYISSTGTPPSQVTADSIIWNLSGINPLFSELLRVKFLADTTLIQGSLIYNSAYITSTASENFPLDNSCSNTSYVITSFDPNFISVNPEIIYTPDLLNDPSLEYTIHFQNTGNAVANYIRIEQSIPPEFNMNTFELLASSHNLTINHGGFIRYVFNNIMLPDSASDPEGSQGFITFRIRPHTGLVAGDSISTVADIYFDYNLAVTTNTAITTIEDPLSYNEGIVEWDKLQVFPNPAFDKISMLFNADKTHPVSVDLYNLYGQKIKTLLHEFKNEGTQQQIFDVSDLPNGMYFLRYENGNSSKTAKFLKMRN